MNLITGFPYEAYPLKKRVFYYFVSTLEALSLLSLTTILKIIIFNINGLIDDKSSIFYLSDIS